VAASGRAAQERIIAKASSRCCTNYMMIFLDFNIGDYTGAELSKIIRQILDESLTERYPKFVICSGKSIFF
jgi:hypothetical protein